MADDTTFTPSGQAVVFESQLDWLTTGWSEGQGSDRAEAWAFARAQAEKRAGFREAPFRLMGYEGYAVGRVRFGRRNGSALLQLSGALAEQYADTIVPAAERVSRVDFAVTVRLARRDPFLGESTYAEAENHHAEHPTSALPSMTQDANGGCTVYLGRRTSDRFFRLYNKEAEQSQARDPGGIDHYERAWRYELECKGSAAASLANLAVRAPNRADFVQQYVYDYCNVHGISPAFSGVGERVCVPGFRRRSDTESRLGWLRDSVNPAILTLMKECDRADILDALGLGESTRGLPDRRPV